MKHVRVAADRWNFELVGSGAYISLSGGNMLNDEHPVQGTLFRTLMCRTATGDWD